MKPESQKLCDKHWQRENLCVDSCPLAKECQFHNGDNYAVWESRMEIAAIKFKQVYKDDLK